MRLFIALPLSLSAERSLDRTISDLRSQDGARAVKWVKAGNVHITLKFIGETEENLVESISDAVRRIAEEHKPVTFDADRLGGFPNLHRPRVIFAGSNNAPASLPQMAEKIDTKLNKLGFEREQRAFKSHLTLGRVRQGAQIGDLSKYLESYKFTPFSFVIDRLVLFKSMLTPKGPIYERLLESILGEERFGA